MRVLCYCSPLVHRRHQMVGKQEAPPYIMARRDLSMSFSHSSIPAIPLTSYLRYFSPAQRRPSCVQVRDIACALLDSLAPYLESAFKGLGHHGRLLDACCLSIQ